MFKEIISLFVLFVFVACFMLSIFSENVIEIPESIIKTSESNISDSSNKEDAEIIIDGEWVLEWHDTFDSLDNEKWNLIKQGNNYNNELQYYKPENVECEDGRLIIRGKKESYKDHDYTSGKITTQNKFEFKYGKVEIIARTNGGMGSFPAIWLLPSNGDTFPEVDIYESVGKEVNIAYYVNHYLDEKCRQKRAYTKVRIDDLDEYHKYTIEWNKDSIKWFVDDIFIYESTEGIPNESMYLIINLAIGGAKWVGSPDETTEYPLTFEIEDLKIMRKL